MPNDVEFRLVPFPGESPPAEVSGRVTVAGAVLGLHYRVRAPGDRLHVPDPADHPGRRDRLWEDTCLEAFFLARGEAGYRELNLSPAGHWNLYRFDAYREGMRTDEVTEVRPLRVRRTDDGFTLNVDLGVSPASIEAVGIAAILRDRDGGTSHLALTHPDLKPDFHHSGGFVLNPSREA